MIEKPKQLTVIIIIALAGVVALYGYALSIAQQTLSIDEIGPEHVGSKVDTTGHIKEIKSYSWGTRLTLIDIGSEATIGVSVQEETMGGVAQQEELVPGAKVKVMGLLGSYKDSLEIEVGSSSDLEIIELAGQKVLDIGVVLDRPEVFEGMNLTLSGTIREIDTRTDGSFLGTFTVRDGTGNYTIMCYMASYGGMFSYENGDRVQEGDKITATGNFQYYTAKGTWELVVDDNADIDRN